MLISYKWLKDFVDPGLNPAELGEKLTLIGLEIDGIEESGDDVIFDIEVTSNRGDCLSHLGVAREVAAVTNSELKTPAGISPNSNEEDRAEVIAPDDCYRFTSRIIKGIKVGPSPDWLVERLEAVGERSINNIADITNYVMHELGNPMHAFDLNKLDEQRIVVRRAKDGEKITTLDEVERKLDTSMLAICDASKPVAVAGIMGGHESGIDENSTDMLLEVAYFDRDLIRKTSSALNLSTEASYRFERGVDIENIIHASNRATELILKLAGGTDAGFTDVYPAPTPIKPISAPNLSDEVTRLSGLEIDEVEIAQTLSGIGIEKIDNDFNPPTWRHDLGIVADLVEEVVRIHGYDKIGESIPAAYSSGEYQSSEGAKRAIRSGLAASGFLEAFSYSFVDRKKSEGFTLLRKSDEATSVTIDDPIIEGADLMRQTLLPGLINAAQLNTNFRSPNVSLFEIGRVFNRSEGNDLPFEAEYLGILIAGSKTYSESPAPGRENDFYDLKGAIEDCFEWGQLELPSFESDDSINQFQNGQSAKVMIGDIEIGQAGKLSGEIAGQYKLKQDVYLAEIDLTAALKTTKNPRTYHQLPRFPATQRDVSLVVDAGVTFGNLRSAFDSEEIAHLANVHFVDEYLGEGIGENKRSMTVRFEYRSEDRTLTDEDANESHKKVLESLEKGFKATFR